MNSTRSESLCVTSQAAGPRRWFLLMAIVSSLVIADMAACQAVRQPQEEEEMGDAEKTTEPAADSSAPTESEDRYAAARRDMVDRQLRRRDIRDKRVLDAMQDVPRHRFVPADMLDMAYADQPLPIGQRQTISQPYIVALMTQLAQPKPKSRALDVGTGSGYQAAVLAELCGKVYSIEIIESLAGGARKRLKELGYDNIQVRCGDGYRGWAEHAPFDLIIVAAAPAHIPQPLIDQLAPGGRLVLPVGEYFQDLMVVEKQQDGTTRKWKVIPVAFVPMTGEAQRRDRQPESQSGGIDE
jgi:protein-L-isoaspartate(D-aspartate) O-methyltransferase